VNKKVMAIISSIAAVVLIAVAVLFVLKENKKYEVSFNSDGGTAVESQEVKKDERATKPTDPTKAKHDFTGWYLDNKEFDFSTPITEDIELTAKWVLSDLVLECNNEHEYFDGAVKLQGQMIVKFDATTQEVKDASGYAKVTFADNATAEKMKEEARANFCPEKVDQSKCVVTVTENVLEIEVKNEKNIVDVDKTMDAIKAELEAEDGGSFVCDLREN
jgi:uncharacterized repeat protein (TIGR02543 family)